MNAKESIGEKERPKERRLLAVPDILENISKGNWTAADIDALFGEVIRLRRENAGLKEFALKTSERLFMCHEILGRLAEKRGKR